VPKLDPREACANLVLQHQLDRSDEQVFFDVFKQQLDTTAQPGKAAQPKRRRA
jgi:hypothetical protein